MLKLRISRMFGKIRRKFSIKNKSWKHTRVEMQMWLLKNQIAHFAATSFDEFDEFLYCEWTKMKKKMNSKLFGWNEKVFSIFMYKCVFGNKKGKKISGLF